MLTQEIKDSFKDKNVVVTGGTGLIGRKVVDMLVDAGANVTSVGLDDLELNPAVNYVKMDLRNFEYCKELTAHGIDYVFHLAGIKGGVDVTKKNPATVFVPYLQFNTNILEACRINNVKKVVYTSTIGAYSADSVLKETEILSGNPMDEYAGWAKRMAELQIQAYKTQYGLKNFIAVRPANVFGEGDNFDPENAMVIPSLIAKIYQFDDNPITVWGDGSAIRTFIYSTDAAEGIIRALYFMPDVPYINICNGGAYSIKDLLTILQSIIPFEYVFDTSKPNGYPLRVMDNTMATSLLGLAEPTDMRTALRNTMKWFQTHHDEYLKRKNYFVK